MAVVQISKIQLRRGKKNSNTGIPQLSSAEMAWAIDTQELYIGNGSVAEGAPFVGNTKILTERDNILELAANYQFGSNEPTINLSVTRSLQSKLDETVSLYDFLVINEDETINWDSTFQNALNQLFRNSDNQLRKTLIIPNTDSVSPYVLTQPLRIPSGAKIRGENKNETIINIANQNIIFVNSQGVQYDPDLTPIRTAVDVSISNLTFLRSSGNLVLSGIADTVFDNVRFEGNYQLGDLVEEEDSAFLSWSNNTLGAETTGIKFNRCDFYNIEIVSRCDQTINSSTKIDFVSCNFNTVDTGILISSGVVGQTNAWGIYDCQFEKVAKHAFKAYHGRGTLFHRCSFKECGNGVNSAAYPLYEIIWFNEQNNNRVIDCNFDRLAAVTARNDVEAQSITEVYNASKVTMLDQIETTIDLVDTGNYLTTLPLVVRQIALSYKATLGNIVRTGTLTIIVDQEESEVSLSDNYNFSPSGSTSEFEFTAAIAAGGIIVNYINPIEPGSAGTLTFNATYGV